MNKYFSIIKIFKSFNFIFNTIKQINSSSIDCESIDPIGNPGIYGKTSIYYEITTVLKELGEGFHYTILAVHKRLVQQSKKPTSQFCDLTS